MNDNNKTNELEISGKQLKFSHKIEEIKQNNEYIFVRLGFTMNSSIDEKEDENNVYAIDHNGQVVWQIKNIAPEDQPGFNCSPIVLMDVDANNQLLVTDFSGRKFEVHLKTGNMKLIGITK